MESSEVKEPSRGEKGSQFWLRKAVNVTPDLINKLILDASPMLNELIIQEIKWVSPLKEGYEEYRDEEFLKVVGYPQLEKALLDFWPKRGPVWDALATFGTKEGRKGVILLEAKSHATEMLGDCRAEEKSENKIRRAFEEVKRFLGVSNGIEWTREYYQYANRLAHLYFLSVMHKIPAWLVFVYFVDDKTIKSPMRKEEWGKTIAEPKKTLGLTDQHALSDRIIEIFPETEQFES